MLVKVITSNSEYVICAKHCFTFINLLNPHKKLSEVGIAITLTF